MKSCKGKRYFSSVFRSETVKEKFKDEYENDGSDDSHNSGTN